MRNLINRLLKRLTWDAVVKFIVVVIVAILTSLGFNNYIAPVQKVGEAIEEAIPDTTKVFHDDLLKKKND